MIAKSHRRPAGLVLAVLVTVGLTAGFWVRDGLSAFGNDVEFRWSILAETEVGMRGLDFSDSMPVVHSGTALQIYLEHIDNCHIYLFLLDSSDILTPIYPAASGYYNYGFPRGPQFIPQGDERFSFVPPPGIETFYLIASIERQFQLEKLTEEFQRNSNSAGQQRLLLTQIEDMLKDEMKRSEAADDREKFEVKVKTAEGIKTKQFLGTDVNIDDFYGRILRIDHR